MPEAGLQASAVEGDLDEIGEAGVPNGRKHR